MKKYTEENEKELRELLLGHSVVKLDEDMLELDNGILLDIVPNSGCGGCESGWYAITELNGCDNVITNVEFCCDSATKDDYDSTSYKIFVLAADKRIKLLQVDGTDGNGYYGTGYSIEVEFPKQEV